MRGHPIFARFYRLLERVAARAEETHRRELMSGARGRVLEIGAGTGANLAHYPEGTTPVLMEPDPHMLRTLRERATSSPRGPRLVRGSADALPFRDGAFDTVIASLVLCSVPDQSRAIGEIRRVLADDGEIRFYEHVRSQDASLARRQDRYERPWGWFSAGCHPNRDTVQALRDAGLTVGYKGWHMKGGWIAAPHVLGTARVSR